MNTSKTNLADVLKAIDNKQDKIAKGISETINKISTHHMNCIQDLIFRCGALEAIQLRLFSDLAETNPLVHKQIVEELKDSLEHVESKGQGDNAFANHLRELVGSQSGKKVHLRLVPKKSSSDSPSPDRP